MKLWQKLRRLWSKPAVISRTYLVLEEELSEELIRHLEEQRTYKEAMALSALLPDRGKKW